MAQYRSRVSTQGDHEGLLQAWKAGLGADTAIDGERLVDMVTKARAARPEIDVDDADFVRHVGTLLAANTDPVQALDGLRGDELLVACGCTLGNVAAHRVFEAEYLPEAKRILARAGHPTDEQEFLQRLRDRLLIRDGDKPSRIAAFSGRGELKNWVRIAAHRLVVDGYRKGHDPTVSKEADATEAIASAAPDPELAALKSTYREGFRAAFETAFARLTPGDRTLLRYRYIDGLEVQQIAAIDGRHRVSISRALSRARDSLLENLRRDLAERLHVGMSEAESMVRLMRSQIDVSISRLLRAD